MNVQLIIHWIAFAVFTWLFGYAAIYKVIQVPNMMQGMASMGFNKNWTLIIGWAELLGVLGLLAGIFFPPLKNLAIIALLPFAIGAFTAHMVAHHGFGYYRNALLVCVLPVILLLTDKRFNITL